VLPFRILSADLRHSSDAGSALAARRILVVDDRDTNREILSSYLHEAGAQVLSATSAQDAFRLARDAYVAGEPIHAAVIDVRMPEENGLDLVRRFRASAHAASLPIIMASSVDMKNDAETARHYGVSSFMTKPVNRDDLVRALAFALDRSGSREIATQFVPARPQINMHVLVAEDNPVNEEVIREYLMLFGVTFELVRNGEMAVDAATRGHFDLIFMDCQMPVMDGLTATRAIRAYELANKLPSVPIVALTANAYSDDRDACLAVGMDDYLSKPFTEENLARVLKSFTAVPARPTPEVPLIVQQQVLPIQSSPVEKDAPSALDKAMIGPLKARHPRLLKRLISTYMDHAPQIFNEALAAIDDRNVTALHLAAHSLKSSSANVGAAAVAEVSKALEAMARENELNALDGLKQDLQTAFEAATKALRSELDALEQVDVKRA
jgi:two-component system, sensor histidine kinase and response regulator